MTHRISNLVWVLAAGEASAAITIHGNIISNGHFPFFVSDTATSTNTYIIITCFWTENESLYMSHKYNEN